MIVMIFLTATRQSNKPKIIPITKIIKIKAVIIIIIIETIMLIILVTKLIRTMVVLLSVIVLLQSTIFKMVIETQMIQNQQHKD